MYKLIIFAVFMLLMSAICNGQGVTLYGASRAQDTSKTKGQQVWSAYAGSADTTILILLPNGTVKQVAKGAFSGAATLQQVLAAGDSSHGNVMKIALDSPSSGHIRLYGGVNTDVWLTNNTGKEFSLGVGGNGTGLEDKFFVYDNTNNLAPFVVDDDGHVHMGGFADVTPGLSVESNLGFSPVITANGKMRLRNTPVRTNFNDSTLGLKSGDTVTIMPPLQPILDGKQAALGYDPLPAYAAGYLAYSDTGTTTRENNVIILSGQSNALGQFPDTAMNYLPLEYYGAQSKIKMWWTGDYDSPVAGHFEDMLVPVNTRDSLYTDPSDIPNYYITGWGVEQSAGRKIQQVLDDTLYVIKSARGGLAIRYWSKDANGIMWQQLYQYITESIDSLDAKGAPINFRALVWMQGESDCLEGLTATYEDSLRILINNVRAIDPRLDSMLWVNVKLRAGTISQGQVDVINAAYDQMAAESPFNVTVDPVKVGTTLFDGLHYGQGYLPLGNAIADTIISHTITNPTLVNIGQGLIRYLSVASSPPFNFKVIPSVTHPTLYLSNATGYGTLHSSTVDSGLSWVGNRLKSKLTTGVAGGQTLNGGTGTNDDLTIRSTATTFSASSYIHNIANNFTFGGTAFTPSMDIHFQKPVNATLGMMLENTNTGTLARIVVDWKNDAGHFGRIGKLSSIWTASGLNTPNAFVIGNAGAGDIVMSNSVATGELLFGTVATLRMKIKASGIVNITNTPTYADNAAALAGGLVAGDIYRTSTGQLMIVF